MRAAIVKTGVDVRETDIDQSLRLIDTGGCNNGFHSKLHGLAQLAVESVLIKPV
jgi:hypothetical protein